MKATKEFKDEFVKTIEQELTIKATCTKLNVSRATLYRWFDEDKQFLKQVKASIRKAILEVNDDCESIILKKIRNEDPGMIKFWLRYHHQDYKQSYVIARGK